MSGKLIVSGSSVILFTCTMVNSAAAQQAAPQPNVGAVNAAIEGNEVANAPVPATSTAIVNPIIRPKPLSAMEQQNALASIDRHIATEIDNLQEMLKDLLPDEIGVLAKTSGWNASEQQALVTALRANDSTAVFKAWSQAAPDDPAGAELAARQTDVRRLAAQLEQDLEKNNAALSQDAEALDEALHKIAVATPAVAEVDTAVTSVKNWIEVRRLVDAATPGKGQIAALPKGEVALVYDPSLPLGTAIVLSDEAVLIGNEGHPGLVLDRGLAAEALGLPIVTGSPIRPADSPEMAGGIMLANRQESQANVSYLVNGMRYEMEPGMAQRLRDDRQWIIAYDRGAGRGPAEYTLAPGTYHFTPTDEGWQLYRQRFDIVLDNSQSEQPFHFQFKGENLTVPAGGTRTLASDYPIVVKFDRGNGTDLAGKNMHFSGHVAVGVNPEDNLWDLFPTTDNQREVNNLKLFQ